VYPGVTTTQLYRLGIGLITLPHRTASRSSDHRCDEDSQKRPTLLLKIL